MPFVRGHRSVFPRTPRNTGVYTRHPTFVTATSGGVDTASGKTLKKRNACLHAVRQAAEKKIACLNGLRSEGVKAQHGRIPIDPAILAAIGHRFIAQKKKEIKNADALV